MFPINAKRETLQLFRKPDWAHDWATCIATTMNSVNAFDEAAGWTDTQQEAIRIEDEGDWHHTPRIRRVRAYLRRSVRVQRSQRQHYEDSESTARSAHSGYGARN